MTRGTIIITPFPRPNLFPCATAILSVSDETGGAQPDAWRASALRPAPMLARELL